MQWEYKTAMDRQLSPESGCCVDFEVMGREGWELVSVVLLRDVWYCFFKRPRGHDFGKDGEDPYCHRCGFARQIAPEQCSGIRPQG